MPRVAPELSGTSVSACRASVRRAGFNSLVILALQPVEGAVALTQTQLATAVADRAQLSRADAKRALAAFDEVVLDQLGNAEKVRIGGLVQLTVRVSRRRRHARAVTRRAVRRSRSPRSRRASICGRGHWRGRRERCRRCRRRVVGSLPEQTGRALRFS